jgi:hypothetical protein
VTSRRLQPPYHTPPTSAQTSPFCASAAGPRLSAIPAHIGGSARVLFDFRSY